MIKENNAEDLIIAKHIWCHCSLCDSAVLCGCRATWKSPGSWCQRKNVHLVCIWCQNNLIQLFKHELNIIFYILSIKENPLEITEIPLLKFVTAVHFLGFFGLLALNFPLFWCLQVFNFVDCGIYTCFVLHVVHMQAFASLRGFLHFILHSSVCVFLVFIFTDTTSLIWVLFDAVLMCVLLHSMLAYGFLAFLFWHDIRAYPRWVLVSVML